MINQKVLSKQLRSTGCVVHVANHGGEALDFLSKTTRSTECNGFQLELQLILMDLEMPVSTYIYSSTAWIFDSLNNADTYVRQQWMDLLAPVEFVI